MAQRPKAKPKRKDRKDTDKEQSARFIETARELGVDESGEKFEKVFKEILLPRPKKR